MSDYHLAPDEERDAYINDADSGMPADDPTNEEWDGSIAGIPAPTNEELHAGVVAEQQAYKELSRSESAAQFFDDLERWWEENPNTINEVRKRIKEREQSHD